MTNHTTVSQQQLDEFEAAIAAYQQHPPIGFACCSAHSAADASTALLAEVRRLRAELAVPRTLTESEHNAAWHAIEGAAGEEGADPGTVLNAVLHALGITPPVTPAVSGAADSRQP